MLFDHLDDLVALHLGKHEFEQALALAQRERRQLFQEMVELACEPPLAEVRFGPQPFKMIPHLTRTAAMKKARSRDLAFV